MIQRNSDIVLLIDENHTSEYASFDLDQLYKDVCRALETCGVHETWVADHAAMAFQDYYESLDAAKQQSLTRTSANELVVRMLIDAGYPDAGWAFAELRNLQACTVKPSPRLPWDEKRVLQTLQDGLEIPERATLELAPPVLKRLNMLGLDLVSDELIVEIGKHVFESSARQHRSKPKESGWLMSGGYWDAFFCEEVAELVNHRVLSIYPVSTLFPLTRLSLDLKRLPESVKEKPDPITEMWLFTVVEECGNTVLRAIETLANSPEVLDNDEKSSAGRMHLVVKGAPTLLKTLFPKLSKKRRSDLESQMMQIVYSALESRKGKGLLISTQP